MLEKPITGKGCSVIEGNVLVLNRSFMPIHVTSIKRAITLVYMGVAKAVNAEYQLFDFESWASVARQTQDQGVIDTLRGAILIPRVICLQMYDRLPKRHVRFSRMNIFARDQNICQYCGFKFDKNDLNIDHVIPRSQGGTSHWENVVCSCVVCNRKKGGRTPEQANMRLRQVPRKPGWSPLLGNNFATRVRHKEWLPFLNIADAAYWITELEP